MNRVIISDLHLPYQHKDALKFLAAVKDEYDTEDDKCVGDVCDNHFGSFHDIEYGTLSNQEERKQACKYIKQLEEIFPELTVSLGNHDMISHRQAKRAGIPEEDIMDFNQRYNLNWDWVEKDVFKAGKQDVLMVHTIGVNTRVNARMFSHSSVQGHHHSEFGISYTGDTNNLRFSMSVGCLIDMHSPAFAYGRGAVRNRPVLGCGVLVEDTPVLVPMTLRKSGRWNNHINVA